MNVTFKGLQNVGAYERFNTKNEDINTSRLIMQLNNKGENKDLDDFKDILKVFPDANKRDVLNLSFNNTANGNYEIYINSRPFYKFSKFAEDWVLKNEKMEKDKWKTFNKILRLLDRISKGKEEFPLSQDYLTSEDCSEAFKKYINFPSEADYNKFIHLAHSKTAPINVASKASMEIKANLDNHMANIKYFTRDVEKIAGCEYDDKKANVMKLVMTIPNKDIGKYKDLLEKFEPETAGNIIKIDKKYDKKTCETTFYVNGIKLNVNRENLPFFATIAQLTTKIANSNHDVPFSFDHLNAKEIDEISTGKENEMLNRYFQMSDDEQYEDGFEFDMLRTSDEVKDVARMISKSIDKKMKHYINS